MKTIQIFDLALGCSSGVCSPTADPAPRRRPPCCNPNRWACSAYRNWS